MRVEDGEARDSALERDLVFLGDVSVLVVAADVDVDEDEVVVQNVEVGLLVHIDVQHLAVSAPISAEVKDDALVFVLRGDESLRDVVICVGCIGVDDFGLRVCGKRDEEEDGGGDCGATFIHGSESFANQVWCI